MDQPIQSTPPVESQGSGGLSWRGLAQVFYAPADFFTQLKESPKILVPYLALIVVTLVFFYLIGDLMTEMQLATPQAQERLNGMEVTPQIRQFVKWQTIIGGSIAIGLMPLLGAAFALFWGNFVFAGKARFKQLMSVMLYGSFLYMVGALAIAPMALAKDSMLVSLSLAVLVADQGPQSLAYVALSKIGLFNIWEIIVVGIGLSALYGVPRNKGYLIAVLSVGLMSVLHIIVTAIGTMFT